MSLRVTLIQGGGTGLDQVPAVQHILKAAGVDITWDEHVAGRAALERGGPALPDEMLQSVRANGLALKTMLLAPPGAPKGNVNVAFRRALDLFASVRPLRNLRGLPSRYQNVDLLVIRELTEDLYAAIEHEIVPGVVQSIKVVTEAACRRFFRFAFEWAQAAGRKTIHCVHKANILKLADGLFLEAFRATAQDFPGLQPKEIIVDNCCMQLVTRPQQFQVLVCGNLYGDLLSDLGVGLVGGISAALGINHGNGVKVYEAIHGGRREEIGANHANPLPLLLPALALLRELGQTHVADRIQRAIDRVLEEGKVRTPDLGGQDTTTAMTEALVKALG